MDIYQFHNPAVCPKPGDGSGLYEAMCEAKAQGKIRHIGITNHRLNVANEAIESGLYETLQFPFNYLATDKEHKLVEDCKKQGVPVLATTLSDISVDYKAVKTDGNFALVMGNEGQGISQEMAESADQLVHISMPGQAESLNVAVAAGILMFSL